MWQILGMGDLFGHSHPWAVPESPILNRVKKGCVCLCLFRENLSLRQKETPNFSRWIFCELTFQNKVGYIVVIYFSSSQLVNKFDDFLLNFQELLNQISQLKSSFLVILGDFNAFSRSWWCDDITTHEATELESLKTSWKHQEHQLISDAIHLLTNSSFCINLVFRDKRSWQRFSFFLVS